MVRLIRRMANLVSNLQASGCRLQVPGGKVPLLLRIALVAGALSVGVCLFSSNLAYGADNIFTENVAIGVSAVPSGDKLYLQGDAGISGNLTVGGTMTYSSDLTMSGTNMLYLANGTVTAPSLTFEDDTDTGIYSPADGQVAITTDGTQRMVVDDSGNVGIGTTPSALLDVAGAVELSGTDNIILNSNYLSGDGGDEGIYIDSSGNVIIGDTSSPFSGLYDLYVTDSDGGAFFSTNLAASTITGRAFAVGVNGENYVRTLFYSNGFIGFGPGNATRDTFIGRSAANTIRIGNDYDGTGTGHLIVNGNVGIGDTTPDAKLDVEGDVTIAQDLTITDSLTVDTDTLYVDSSNNRVGIGTTSPSYALHVNGSMYSSGLAANGQVTATAFRSLSDGLASSVPFGWNSDIDTGVYRPADNSLGLATGGTERIRIDSSGNVGIGTTSPGAKLDVAGDALITSDLGIVEAAPSGDKLYVGGNAGVSGDLTIGGTVSFSDDLTISGAAFVGGGSGYISGIDTTDNQLEVNDGTAKAIPLTEIWHGPLVLASAWDEDAEWPLMWLHADRYPHGIVITKWYVQCNSAAPTTELAADLKYCDDNTTGAFPGANAQVIDVLDTDTGNSSETDNSNMLNNGVVPSGKKVYISMDSDPTDVDTYYELTIIGYIPQS